MISDHEVWAAIPSWEGLYEASSLGRIRSVPRVIRYHTKKGTLVERPISGRIMKPSRNDDGYLGLMLSREGVAVHREVHVLVCSAFHGARPKGMQAAHNDGDPSNCREYNLRWATPGQNAEDKRAHGTLREGQSHYRSRITNHDAIAIRASAASLTELSAKYGMCRQAISKIRTGQSWRSASAA